MNSRQAGFTTIEILAVSVISAAVLVGIFQSLIAQDSHDTGVNKIRDQKGLSVGMGILEAELREVGSMGGPASGGSDVYVAASDSIVFRAQRKSGFICKMSRDDRWAITWVLGDEFEVGDPLLVFIDGDSLRYDDDRWATSVVTHADSTTDSDCEAYWPGIPLQRVRIDSPDMSGVRDGAPMRSYEQVTYSLRDFGSQGHGLVRIRVGDSSPSLMASGLAAPPQGLEFEYFDPSGAATSNVDSISSMKITVRMPPRGTTDMEAASMSTDLYLRNN